MKRLAPLALLALPCLFTSCGLANGLMQGPYRLLQSAGRTISKNDHQPSRSPGDMTTPSHIAIRIQEAH